MEQWCVYACDVDGRPAFITCDQAAEGRLRTEGLDTLLVVRADLRQLDGQRAAAPPLKGPDDGEVERQLIDTMGRIGARHVGKVAHDRTQSWYFYAPQGVEPKSPLRSVELANRIPLSFVLIEDPDHTHYRTTLLPGPDELRTMRDLRALEILAAQGDLPDRARRIDYVADFMDDAARDRFCQAVAERGFTVTGVAAGKEPMPARAFFHRVATTELASISDTSDELQRLVARHKGRFVGWTAPPVTT